jgi:hypothetical protein
MLEGVNWGEVAQNELGSGLCELDNETTGGFLRMEILGNAGFPYYDVPNMLVKPVSLD